MIDTAAIAAALYARVASDSAGAAVRALIGSGSIFEATDPINLTGKTLPYLLFRDGSADPSGQGPYPVEVSWFVYVEPLTSPRLLRQMADALVALYGYHNRHAMTVGHTEVPFVGRTFYDGGFKLNGKEVRVIYRD